MATHTVTSRGQMTLRKDFLRHLGIRPGDAIEIEKAPNGELRLHAPRKSGDIRDVFGMLEGKTKVKATLEEIRDATERAWAGER